MGKQYYIGDRDRDLIVDGLYSRIWTLDEQKSNELDALHWAVQSGKTVFRDEPKREDIDGRLPDPIAEYRIQMEKFVNNRESIRGLVKSIREARAEINRIKKLIRRFGYDPD